VGGGLPLATKRVCILRFYHRSVGVFGWAREGVQLGQGADCCPGGLVTVHEMDKYTILGKIGEGTFSTVRSTSLHAS
jgi:hypothetical protein